MSIAAIFALASRAWGILKFWKILWNAPKIYKFTKKFGGVAGSLVTEHRLPNGPESEEFLYALAELLRTQIVDFPNLDEDAIADKLVQLATELKEAS